MLVNVCKCAKCGQTLIDTNPPENADVLDVPIGSIKSMIEMQTTCGKVVHCCPDCKRSDYITREEDNIPDLPLLDIIRIADFPKGIRAERLEHLLHCVRLTDGTGYSDNSGDEDLWGLTDLDGVLLCYGEDEPYVKTLCEKIRRILDLNDCSYFRFITA